MKIPFTTSTVLFSFAVINGTTVVQHVTARECQKSNAYQCGVIFPSNGSGDTCDGMGCCCDGKDGTGLQVATCRTNNDGYTNRGCDSCWGNRACGDTTSMNIGTNACHGNEACYGTKQSTIETNSCLGLQACYHTTQSTIESNACHEKHACEKSDNSMIKSGACVGKQACYYLKDSSIGENSCNGNNACNSNDSFKVFNNIFTNLNIGNNACNGDGICKYCESNSVVPNDACNDLNGDDVTNGYCNYCSTGERGTCSDGDNNNCATGLVCGRYNNNANAYQCCTCTNNDCVMEGQDWCRNNEGGACSDGNNNNCATGLVCGRYNNVETDYQCCKEYYWSSGVAICYKSSPVTNMLVGSSNEIHQESIVTSLTMLGFLGLAMVATFKIAKDYHHHHQEQYNQLE